MAVYTQQTLEALARQGANIDIDGAIFIPAVLMNLARMTRLYGGHLTVRGPYSGEIVEKMAALAGNHLTVVVRPESGRPV